MKYCLTYSKRPPYIINRIFVDSTYDTKPYYESFVLNEWFHLYNQEITKLSGNEIIRVM
ncbi:hypothetical protein [Candidatus Enterovibrio altilux]|uniref:hypothetical protein n=1 Tax=Candidatus Enterovibrio altilux TaxID=1927128 RepID=UPI0037433D70